MAQAIVKYRDENGATQEHSASFGSGADAEAYAASVVRDGFGVPAGATGGPGKFYPAESVSVVEVSG